jgi:hypothetical protein
MFNVATLQLHTPTSPEVDIVIAGDENMMTDASSNQELSLSCSPSRRTSTSPELDIARVGDFDMITDASSNRKLSSSGSPSRCAQMSPILDNEIESGEIQESTTVAFSNQEPSVQHQPDSRPHLDYPPARYHPYPRPSFQEAYGMRPQYSFHHQYQPYTSWQPSATHSSDSRRRRHNFHGARLRLARRELERLPTRDSSSSDGQLFTAMANLNVSVAGLNMLVHSRSQFPQGRHPEPNY